ncbi:MAG TPA: carboxylesterase/lipase family protein [Acidimicrobiia bacterium]|jgi:para-nitrobenzyl esterase
MTDAPIATTTAGNVRGKLREGIKIFRGIPYAAPPVGERRFRPPAPVEPWTEVLDAIHAGPVAPQNESPLEKSMGAPPPRWDEARCLTLNVWTPALDGAKRPVLFWIHGGAFLNGSGATPIYDGTRFAEHGDVVVVTINYRLGTFGFLHLDEIFGDEVQGSGNAGILDQVAALEWVRDNIAAFGGDPGNVTIFGESAGGMSVGTLLGLPKAQGLFHKAIAQSGASSFAASSRSATAVARRILDSAGVSTIEELRTAPAEQFLGAQEQAFGRRGGELPFRPVIDGVYLPELPLEAIRAGSGAVPTIAGTTRDEMQLFLGLQLRMGDAPTELLAKRLQATFGEGTDTALAVYRANRPGASERDLTSAVLTDATFRIPAIRLAEAQAGNGVPAFMYWFTFESTAFDGILKSCHALELPFVWDALDRPGLAMLTGDSPARQPLADAMHAAWLRFARTGDPGWPRYATTSRTTQRFDTTLELVDDPDGTEREVWSGRDGGQR